MLQVSACCLCAQGADQQTGFGPSAFSIVPSKPHLTKPGQKVIDFRCKSIPFAYVLALMNMWSQQQLSWYLQYMSCLALASSSTPGLFPYAKYSQ